MTFPILEMGNYNYKTFLELWRELPRFTCTRYVSLKSSDDWDSEADRRGLAGASNLSGNHLLQEVIQIDLMMVGRPMMTVRKVGNDYVRPLAVTYSHRFCFKGVPSCSGRAHKSTRHTVPVKEWQGSLPYLISPMTGLTVMLILYWTPQHALIVRSSLNLAPSILK